MSDGFRRSRTGRIILRVDPLEKALLVSLASQLIDFVVPLPLEDSSDPVVAIVGIDSYVERPQDPALIRLFPDAYSDDPEAAGDFRRFTERDLRETKASHARTAASCLERSGEKIALSADEALSWMGFLNDARLTLGTRMDITEENHEELAQLPEEDERLGLLQAYDWLTFLQDSLVQLHLMSSS